MPAKYAQKLQQTYARIAQNFNKVNAENIDTEETDYFLSLLPVNAEILDFGGGTGRDSKYFAAKGHHLTILDNSAEMLVIAHQNVPTAKIIEADMTEVNLTAETYDGIWARASLLHLTKDEVKNVLKKLHAALKPDGVLYVKVKEGEGEREVAQDKYSDKGQKETRFFSFFQEDELVKLIEQSGFEVVKHYLNQRSDYLWVTVYARRK
jgi:ubiquinone/menaquinone biosynthesis C-methylase UbiE